ncbi:MAG: hypothetical protein CVT98_11095 [Bacteroidetes bacterium HGW-Bacteroidetes-15]|nr:MAG: hypothetical protein CVT98_11095 [Bacteroidetes bacterium HGW-Bacteroidetes-15]
MKKTSLLFFVLLNVYYAFGNIPKDTIPVIHFQLTDATNGKPVSLAHIINTGQKKGIIADMLGYFKMPVSIGDTLIISALNFHQMKIPSWGQFSSDSLYYPIRLTPRSYEIREVRITRFGSYQRFIREVTNMDLPKSEQELLQERLQEYFRNQITKLNLISAPSEGGGFVFGKDWLAIQKEKIEEKRAEELLWNLILRKFSAGIVNELTGLEGIEAIKFMEYCNFTEGYLLLSSDYEVRKSILDKFEAYKQALRK